MVEHQLLWASRPNSKRTIAGTSGSERSSTACHSNDSDVQRFSGRHSTGRIQGQMNGDMTMKGIFKNHESLYNDGGAL